MILILLVAADALVEHGFISTLLDTLLKDDDPIVVIHLETLQSLMYGEGKCIALELGAFDIFVILLIRLLA